ncbi:hypothetical protein FSARC_6661 [Fusarium sarcochroum]|uniref:Zinc-binding loop region of homing endonuclease domain-containing protein n=1 Tax=Fusarium sarcochroum TaxID=1208366 RepID=A0A8H4X856_9HYPO|nr:hypothetical protein FSARC_6661 [Fusarium sarcochroum]
MHFVTLLRKENFIQASLFSQLINQLRNATDEKFFDILDDTSASYNKRKTALGADFHSDQIATHATESQCFTGIYDIFPDANATQGLQIFLSMENRHTWALYNIFNIEYKGLYTAILNPCREGFYFTQRLNVEEFLHLSSGHYEVSHLCNMHRCINPLHMTVETHRENVSRSRCFNNTADHYPAHDVERYCTEHHPPCLLQLAAMPALSRILDEYEMTNPLPNDLPPLSVAQPLIETPIISGNVRAYVWRRTSIHVKRGFGVL